MMESLREMVQEVVRQEVFPQLLLRSACSLRQWLRSPRHQSYSFRQPTLPERHPLQDFYQPNQYYPGWLLINPVYQPPQPHQILHPRYPSRRPATAQQGNP